MDAPWVLLRRKAATVRARADVANRLRELNPLTTLRPRRLLDLLGLRPAVLIQAGKIALSTALGWALAQLITGNPAPIYAPIAAAFVALATVRASVKDAAERVIGVILGVLFAMWIGPIVGLHAWSIGLVIAVGFLIGKILRMQPGSAAQIPVSGLLMLAIGQHNGYAETRILDTLIGAAVAVVVNFVILPPNHVTTAQRSAGDLAEHIIDVLSDMATGIGRPWRRAEADGWLQHARSGRGLASTAQSDVDLAVQGLRLRPGRANWAQTCRAVQRAVDTLGVVEVQSRVLARTLRDTADRLPGTDGRQPALPRSTDMLAATAGAVQAFAQALQVMDGEPLPRDEALQAVATAEATVADVSGRVRSLLDEQPDRGLYIGTLVVETGRILVELRAGLAVSAAHPDAPGTQGAPDSGGEPDTHRAAGSGGEPDTQRAAGAGGEPDAQRAAGAGGGTG